MYHFNNALHDARRIAKNNPKEEFFIVKDDEHPGYDFTILNREEYDRECHVSIKYFEKCAALVAYYPGEPGYAAGYDIEKYSYTL